MSLKIEDLANQLIDGALATRDGWPGKDGTNFSLTVSAEAAIAVTEYLEQCPQPRTEDETKRRKRNLKLLQDTEQKIRANLAERIDKEEELDVWHFSMSLAAIANIRMLLIREGEKPDQLEKNQIETLANKAQYLNPVNPTSDDDIGLAWAFLRAMELLRRTRLTANFDTELWNILGNPTNKHDLIGKLSLIEADIRSNLLSNAITDGTSDYVTAVQLDIAVNTLKNFGRSMSKKLSANAEARIAEGLSRIQIKVGDSTINSRFPVEIFEKNATGNSSVYVVITGPTIISSLAYCLDSRSNKYFNMENRQRVLGYFYCAIQTLSDDIDGRRFWGYGPPHCLRVLSEIQANKRDTDAALDALRGLQTANTFHGSNADRLHALSDALDRSPLVFREPGHPSFVALAQRPLALVLAVLLVIFIAITALVHNGKSEFAAWIAAIPAFIVMNLLLWNWIAALNHYAELQTRGRTVLKALYVFQLFMIVAGMASIVSIFR